MKNPLPLILTLAVGGLLMSRGSRRSNPVETDEIPTSLDYDDPELKNMLADDEDESDEDESGEEE